MVASEVRALAQRSAGAAKEIKDLIQASSQRVDLGAQLVEESAAAAESLNGQAQQLSTLVMRFRLRATA